MHEQNTASAIPRRRVGREVVAAKAITPITASLFEEYAREYFAGDQAGTFVEFLARRMNVTKASAEMMLAACYLQSRVTYRALKVGLLGVMDEADRAGRAALEDVA